MATKTLSENISQAISDFDGIKQAIIDKGVEIPTGTPTSKYGAKIGEIQSGGGGSDEEFIKMVERSATEITLPNGLTKIRKNAFQKYSTLNSVEIPGTVTIIGSNAFYSCTGLEDVTFKGTPTSIDSTAFNGCTNLTTIRVPWSEGEVENAPWGATSANLIYGYTV